MKKIMEIKKKRRVKLTQTINHLDSKVLIKVFDFPVY